MAGQAQLITSGRALVFRITHRANIPWIFANGIHCSSSAASDPAFVPIGNPELISKRHLRTMPPPLGGTLSDYIPFYFTPHSIMMLNIVTGHNGVPRQEKRDIVILATSIPKLTELGVPFVFSDRHAYLTAARFSARPQDLEGWIPWQQLAERDFRRDPNDPAKLERYQAEALVHRHMPLEALSGVVCYEDVVRVEIEDMVAQANAAVQVVTRRGWYH